MFDDNRATDRARPHDRRYRIEQCPTQKPHIAEGGHVAVPLWVLRDEEHLTDVTLLLRGRLDDDLRRSVDRLLRDDAARMHPAARPVAARRAMAPGG